MHLANKNIFLVVDENITLKSLVDTDVKQNYVNWLNDIDIVQYTEQKNKEHDLNTVKQYVSDQHISQNSVLFGIFFKKNHIGNIKIGNVRWEEGVSEIGYIIGEKKFWGKGIATKVLNFITIYAFNEIGINKFIAGFHKLNIASYKVLTKCGFKNENEEKNEKYLNIKNIRIMTLSKKL